MFSWSPLAYLLFTGAMLAVLAGIAIYNYMPSRKRVVEDPKYRMLDDNDE